MISARIALFAGIAYLSFLVIFGCSRPPGNLSNMNEQLLKAASAGDPDTVRRLLKDGANVSAADSNGWTPLMLAKGRGNEKVVNVLIENGANTEIRNSDGETALNIALNSSNAPVTELLLDRVSDPKSLNEDLFDAIRNSPIVLAVYRDEKDRPMTGDAIPPDPAVKLLIEKGADMNARDDDGRTFLIAAAEFGQLARVKALVEKGADMEAKDNEGNTPLLGAACDCAVATMPDTYDVIRFLLEKGANINAMNKAGDTALMIASSGGVVKIDIVKLLIVKGANLTAKDTQGHTALMIARRDNVPGVAQLLRTALPTRR